MTGMGLLSATPSRYFAYHPVEGGKSFTMNITLPIVNLSNFLLKPCSKVGLIIMLLLPVWQIQAQVDLVLSPVTSTVDVGENLTLTLQVIAGTEEINGVSAFLDFDPAFVTISSVEYNASAQLPVPLPNAGESDPTGKIDNSYGTFGAPATGTFDFITINLTATAAGTTTIDFAFEADANPQRLTSVTASDGQGTLLLGTATGATITIVDPAANTPPTVSITSPLDGATYAEGEEVVLAATAEDADGSVSSVEFFDGTTSLGIDTEAPFSATLANVAAGAHDFTAVATDNDGATTTSATVTVTASTPATEPVVTVGGPAAKMVAEDGSLQIPVSISDLDGDNLTVIITSISNEPKLLESSTGSGTQVDPYPLSADAFLTVSDEVNNPGAYSANLNFTPTFGDGGGADGDGDGVYTVTVTVSDGNSSVNTDFTLTVTDVAQPLSTTATTRIEAESFDNQGPPNSGSNPGNKGIGAEINDATGIINIGFTHVGDFAEYEIDVPQAGTYDFSFEVAKGSNGTGTMQIRVQDGGPALGAISVTKTANWLTYETVAASVDLPAGPQTLRFDWSAGSGFLFNIDYFDVSFAGDAAPVVAITSPADGSTFEEGSSVTVTVDATDDGGVTQVELFDGTTSLGIDTEAPYAFSILNGTGTYVLTAEASDGTATTTSEAVTITAVGANTAPVVSIVAPLDGAAVSRGTDITLTATVNDAEESGLEAGLQWTSSDTQLSTDPVSGTGASITGQLVTPGTQTITATATDSGNLTGSDVVTVTVAGPQVAFTAPADNATLSSTNVQLQWTATDVLYDLTEHFHLYVNPAELNDLSSVDHISTASEIGQTSWDLTEADGLTAGENTVVIRVANQFHEVFLTDPNDPTSFIQDVVTFTVNVPDVTAPVITLLGDNPLNLSVGDAYTEFGATATDNIDGDLTASIAIDASTVDVNTEGTYTVAYSVSDAAGNLATAARTVSVAAGVELPDPCENTLYRINVGGPATPSADATPLGWSADQGNFTSANNSQYLVAMTGGNSIYKGDASNAHGGPIIMTDPSVPTSAPAGIFFTERYDLDSNPEMKWEFPIAPGTEVQVTLLFAELYGPVDAAGQRIFDVSLEGTVLPAFDGIDPIAIAGPKGAFSRSATLTVTDGTLDIEFLHTGNDNPALKGIQICGISAPADDTPPVITLLGDNPLELQVGATYTDPGATATDDVDGDLTAAIVVAGDAVDTSVDGTYVVTYNVTDAAGNAATEMSRTVTVNAVVVDDTAPVITLLGDNPLELQVGATYTDPGATATDDVDGDLTAAIVVAGDAVDTSVDGTYVVTYNVTDAAGNAAVELSRTVNVNAIVVDDTAPVITLLGDNPLNLSVGDAYTEFGATAADNIDGDLTTSIAIDASTVDVNTEGTYTVAYSVSDAAGNLATAARTVSVAAGVELPDPCENTLYRINVGGPATPSADATPLGWSADQGNFTSANNSQYLVAMTGGNSIYKGDAPNAHGGPIITTDPSVPTSAPAGIFFTERYDLDSNPEMKWEFPIAPGTEVQVTLLFAELYGPVDAAGQRIFDVSLEGTVLPAFDGIDPIAIAGPKGAFSRSATLTVTDGTLDIEFLHTGNDNPALKGIQICGISAPADDTPPVITLLGDNPLELQVGATYTEPGATATDDVDGDLTAAIVVAGDAVDTSVDGTYVVTYNVTDAAGNAATEVSRTVTVSPVVSNPIVQIEILPGADLDASTFGGSNNFQIANQSTGSLQVTSVTFDLSTGILPDMVFDPTGTGGDETAQCFNAGGSASAVGLVTPANACVDPFSGARNGGFDVLSMDFTDFDPGEIFTFSVDVDPNSIQGVPGAGAAGAVSGYELVGATLTLTFSDGSTLVSSLYEDGSLGGSQAVVSAGAPATPTIAVVGIASAPATVSDLDQIVTVSGTPGDHVSLLVMDSRLYINSGAPPFGVSEVTYYANEAMSGKGLYTAIIEAGGTVDIPVTLLVTESGNTTPNGGLNQLIAVTSVGPYAADQAVSNTSNVITLLYDSNEAPVAVASANVLTGPAPLEVLFDGSGSSDSDGTISSYEWTWDGGTASGVSPTVTFAEGTYEVTLTVTDDDNATATDQLTLVVGESDDDGDGVANGLDNCPTVANVDQLDTDNDGLGDVCDDDIDGDGILNADDCAPLDDQIGAATVDFTVEVDPSDASGLTFTLMGSSTVPVTSWAYTVDGQPLATTADASVTLASASETVNVCLEIVTDCGTVQVCQEVTATFQSQPGCDLVRFGGGINYISFDVLPEEGQRSISQVLGAAAGRMIYIQRRTPFGEVQTYIPIAPSIGTDFDIVPGEAYLVFATQPGQINLCGNTVDPDFRMAIPGGYAWVGYVPSAETTPTEYFGTIPGLFYALGRRGDFTFGDSEYYVPSQPNQTSLTRVANGEGYEVLTFGGGASQGSWLNGPKSFPPVDPRPLKHASRVYTVLYGTAQALQAGDVISVVDTEGVVHAELQVEEDGSIHTTTVFGYDELTQANPELQVGEELYFEFDGMVADQTLSFRGKGGIERIELTFAQTTSVNTSVAGPTMTAYPNPFLEELTVDVPLQVVGRLHITLIDARGRVVADEWIENSISTQGTQTVKLATQNLPVGMYLLRCDLAGEGIMTRKLQRVR